RGVLHRDLKPSNILIDDQEEPQLTDFGLAKILESDRGETRSEAILGTASYMSPEQALGKTKQVTIAADVYSLGAVLYELLVARPVKLWERGWKWVHRHPMTAALSAAVLASILIGAVGIAWQRHLTSQQHQQAEEQAARGRLRRIEELFARDIGGPALAELAAL